MYVPLDCIGYICSSYIYVHMYNYIPMHIQYLLQYIYKLYFGGKICLYCTEHTERKNWYKIKFQCIFTDVVEWKFHIVETIGPALVQQWIFITILIFQHFFFSCTCIIFHKENALFLVVGVWQTSSYFASMVYYSWWYWQWWW